MAYVVAVMQRTSFGVASFMATERFDAGASSVSLFAVVQLLTYAAMQVPVGVLADADVPGVLRLLPAWFSPGRIPVLNQLTGMLGQTGQLLSSIPLAAALGVAGWTPAFLLHGLGYPQPVAAGLFTLLVIAGLPVKRHQLSELAWSRSAPTRSRACPSYSYTQTGWGRVASSGNHGPLTVTSRIRRIPSSAG